MPLAGHKGEVLDGQVQPERATRRDRRRRRHRAALGCRHRRSRSHVLRAHRGGVFATRFGADGTRLATLGADRAVRVWDVRSRPTTPSAPWRPRPHRRGRRLGRGGGVRRPRPHRGRALAAGNQALSRRGEGVRHLLGRSGRRGQGSGRYSPGRGHRRQPRRHDARRRPSRKRPAPAVRIAVREAARRRARSWSDGPRRRVQPRRAARRHRRRGRAGEDLGGDTRKAPRGRDAPRPHETGRQRLVRPRRNPARHVGRPPAEARVWDVSPAGRGEVLTLPGPETDEHADIAFSPDGRRLIAASGREGTVRVWSVDTGAELLESSISMRERALRSAR